MLHLNVRTRSNDESHDGCYDFWWKYENIGVNWKGRVNEVEWGNEISLWKWNADQFWFNISNLYEYRLRLFCMYAWNTYTYSYTHYTLTSLTDWLNVTFIRHNNNSCHAINTAFECIGKCVYVCVCVRIHSCIH